jgi:hypothetical protein
MLISVAADESTGIAGLLLAEIEDARCSREHRGKDG